MNTCGVNRLKLTPNVDNEFIFTIKENGKVTPMPISVSGSPIELLSKEYIQSSVRTASSQPVEEVNKIVEIGFPYAFVLGQSNVTKSDTPPTAGSSGVLWQNTANSTLYKYGGAHPYNANDWAVVAEKITLGSNELIINLSYAIDIQELPILNKIKNWAVALGYTCKISSNKLLIEKNNDFTYTFTSGLSGRVSQEYVKGNVGTNTQYTMVDTINEINLNFIPATLNSNILVRFSFPVIVNGASSAVSSYTIVKGSSGYPGYLTIKMLGSTTAQETISKLKIIFTANSAGTDSFVFKFIRLSNNETVDLIKVPQIFDAANGKVKLVIETNEVNAMISLLGEEVDRYYLKYVYRLLLEAETAINGSFIAEIRKVAIG